MSDPGVQSPSPSRQPGTRRKRPPRGGRHGLSRPAAPVELGQELEPVQVAAPVAAVTSRRVRAERPVAPPAITREAEMAYVRADMRKLLVISGGLLALMLLILAVAGR